MQKRRNRRPNRHTRKRGRRRPRPVGQAQELEGNLVDLDQVPSTKLRYRDIIVPDRMYTRLCYDFNNYPILSAGATGSLLIAGNSCFDPDKTGVGHQPLGFDQFVGFYNRYRVHKSEITVELISATLGCHIVVTPTTTSSAPPDLTTALESPYTMSMPISSSVFKNVKTRKISTRKIWGMHSITQDDLYQAVYSADPVRLWLWKMMAETLDGASSATVRVNIRVTYYVEFFERSVLSQYINIDNKEKQRKLSKM